MLSNLLSLPLLTEQAINYSDLCSHVLLFTDAVINAHNISFSWEVSSTSELITANEQFKLFAPWSLDVVEIASVMGLWSWLIIQKEPGATVPAPSGTRRTAIWNYLTVAWSGGYSMHLTSFHQTRPNNPFLLRMCVNALIRLIKCLEGETLVDNNERLLMGEFV